MPSTLALVAATFEGEERGAAIGSWASWGAVAAALGPLVAGVLIGALSWRAIFFLSLPLVSAALGISLPVVEESRSPETTARKDGLRGRVIVRRRLRGRAV